ncbi:MAG: hypothetical protein ABI047_03145 [Jatrophihabitantaceae bacterium]
MSHADPNTRSRALPQTWTERLSILFATLTVIAVVVSVLAIYYARRADSRSEDYEDSKTAAVQALGTANSSLTKAGLPPVPTPTNAGPAPTVTVTRSPASGAPGPTGAAGPGPSAVQIQNAVASYCSAVKCGSGPTAAQVAQAVATYCRSDGRCQGPAGSDATGAPGVSGAPGASGAPGQNATADQVAAAVATYCAAHEQCAGPAGADGRDATGAPGSPGPSGASGGPGQPPVSWTYTDALGVDHTCSRTDPFDAAAPTYRCD